MADTTAPPPAPTGRSGRRNLIYGVIAVIAVLAVIGAVAGKPEGGPGASTNPSASAAASSSTAIASPSSPVSESSAPASQAAGAFAPIARTGPGHEGRQIHDPGERAGDGHDSNTGGSSNFVVTGLAADGSTNDLLVNVIGNYAGTVLFDTDEGVHTVAFKIESKGSWKVTIKPVTAARVWATGTKLTGKGDDVVRLNPPASGLTTATFTHTGKSNFVVMSYSADGTDLLVNEIGNFNGQTTLPDGTLLLQVEADGSWSVTPD
jgi:hypothetical protein